MSVNNWTVWVCGYSDLLDLFPFSQIAYSRDFQLLVAYFKSAPNDDT